MSKFRYRLSQILIAIAFVVIVGRLAQFQILEAKKYRGPSKKPEPIAIARGEIIDRNSKVLAMDIIKYTLEYNPVDSKENRDELFYKLETIFDFKRRDLLDSSYSQTLAHNLNKEQAQEIKKLNSKLLYLRKMRKRFYPQNTLAAHTLGYVDLYGKARQGIEAKFEELLLEDPESKLKLSLDSKLQAQAEKILNQRVEETQAQKGTALIMKVSTGEVLAWALSPSFDPNNYYSYNLNEIKNWSLVDVYQPGSIFKIITVASALSSGTIDKNYEFWDQGFLKVDNWTIKNHHYSRDTKAENLNLQKLFARSSNTFASHLGLKMGPKTFYRYIRKFGFGETTNIELDGESKGILHQYKKWRKSDTATTSMGHGAISVTPLQLITAVNTVANSGKYVKPTLLFQETKNNNNKENKKEQDPNQIIPPSIAKHINQILHNAIKSNVETKYAQAGKVQGLEISGKTGTAEKIKAGGGYSKKNTIASFIGYFPSSTPRYIVLVVIDDPKTDGRWGDTVAGPVFNQIASYIKNIYL